MTSTTADQDRFDIIAMAPHPDDLEIICGGTLALLVQQGYRVGILDYTTGEPTPRGSEETRAAESEAARKVLGVQMRKCLHLPNRVLMDCPENRFVIATELRRYRPSILLITYGRTPAASPDHYQGQLLGEASRFYSQLTKWDERFDKTTPYRVPHLVYAPFPFDAEQRHFQSTFVVDIHETFDKKLEAIACYGSQFDEERLKRVRHFVTGHCIHTGSRCGFAYGEAFALPHPVGTKDLPSLVQGNQGSPAPVQLPGQSHLPMG